MRKLKNQSPQGSPPMPTHGARRECGRGLAAACALGLLLIAWGGQTLAAKPPNAGGGKFTCLIQDPGTITQDVPVDFTGTVTGDRPPYTVKWTFPDAEPGTVTTPVVPPGDTLAEDITFQTQGLKTVTMTATGQPKGGGNKPGSTCTATRTVDVQPPGDNNPPMCTIDTPQGPVSIATGGSVDYTGTVTDQDNDQVSIIWNFLGGSPSASTAEDPGKVTYNTVGIYKTTLDAKDVNGASCQQQSVTVTVTDQPNLPDVSINSTSQTCGQGSEPLCSDAPATDPTFEQPKPGDNNSLNPVSGTGTTGYQILAINDLGMHCGDLDTRVASILPPFQVLLAQVIRKGAEPQILPRGNGSDQAEVVYSAASNPNDPALAVGGQPCKDGQGNLVPCVGVYKTNFWDYPIPLGSYDPFYPPPLTPLLDPKVSGGGGGVPNQRPVTADVGLPVPNVERLYILPDGTVVPVFPGTGDVWVSQQDMPGILDPYVDNKPQLVEEHLTNKPFFPAFPFGYIANGVNWHEGAGIPFAAYDDFGRENAYPLVRVQAKRGGVNGTTLATVDTVLPISGEASCKNCHADPMDNNFGGSRTGVPTKTLLDAELPVVSSEKDPQFGSVPIDVSVEWATDINVLRLHDKLHGSQYVAVGCSSEVPGSCTPTPCVIDAAHQNGDGPNCLTYQALPPAGVDPKPIVCQVCHYTPALDLAQVGPVAGAAGTTVANGRNQLAHPSNSRVMHGHHGQFTDLFKPIPLPQQDINPASPKFGEITNQTERVLAMNDSCYQCHPGTQVQCLRGAMFNGGMLCSDCHGDMKEVGNDFTANVSPDNPGPASFLFGGNYYDHTSTQPRVPWANEPDCGSCHTGNWNDNALKSGLVTDAANGGNAIVNAVDIYGNPDNLRLRVAYRVDLSASPPGPADPKATPIVPINTQFAANTIPASFGTFTNPGAGSVGTTGAENPKLYRVSNGHGGVFCEGCHGATHAEWPNGNPDANDNLAAKQLQGHTGTVTECSTCHGAGFAPPEGQELGGPHGMHVVGNSSFAEKHNDVQPRQACYGCHGGSSLTNSTGTVLSRAATTRTLETKDGPSRTFQQGEAIGCADCHRE